MSFIKKSFLLAAIVAGTAAHAAPVFDYSYTDINGVNVSGTFTGTANGNLVTGIDNVTGHITSTNGYENGYVFSNLKADSYTATGGFMKGGAVASFDGLVTNVFFDERTDAGSPFTLENWFYIIPFHQDVVSDATQTVVAGNFSVFNNGNYNLLNWHLVAEEGTPPVITPSAPGAVPEPETLALAGLGILAAALARRRRD